MESETFKKIYVHSESDLPKEIEKRYYVHVKGDFNLRSVRIPSASYRALRKRIDWYLINQEDKNDK